MFRIVRRRWGGGGRELKYFWLWEIRLRMFWLVQYLVGRPSTLCIDDACFTDDMYYLELTIFLSN